MKQLHLWLAAILLLSGSFYAQAQTETDTTFASQMNYIFANVDKSKVPYGILRDYAMEFTNLDNYNGTAALADSNYTDGSVFWDAYNTLLMGRIHSSASGFVHPDTLDNQWFTYRQPGRITLAGLYFVYSRFKDNAANNYITVGNNQLYDKYVNGVWQNPYQSENIFLLSPSITDYHGTNFSILLPSNLWLTNNSTGVSGISINVNDGLGYRALVPGTAINVNYADTGTKEWVYKLTLTNSTVLYAHSRVHIANAINQSSGAARFRGATETITADVAYNGTKGIGYITIDYANADRQLHNPLIVAEGYDPGNIFNPEEPTGVMNIDNFIIDATNDGSQLTNLLSGAAQQYDIVYVDWKNGTDYLQRNALLLETVINIINNRKAAAGIVAPNVVVGQSMGGVIARYALKDMENNGERHQTRLFISHDAPQQGANVPQGYQHLGRHVKSLYVRMGIANITQQISLITTGVNIRRALSLADEPASKQMLINYVNSNNIIDNTVHDAWQTELKNLGYPNGDGVTPFRKVAISNGSECGTPQAFSAGSNLLTFNGKANTRFLGDIVSRTAFPVFGFAFGQPALFIGAYVGRNDFVFDIAANAQADGVGNQVYKGKITYTKKILWLISISITLTNRSYNSSASTLPYDYFPGGYYDLRNFNFDLQSSSYQGLFIKYNITASNQPTFNFVPTPSALDIGLGNTALSKADYLARYVGANPPIAPKNTPFQNFVTAFDGNSNDEPHISFERRNGDWLADELNGNHPAVNCSFLCSNNGITIAGPSTICNAPQVYTLTNAPIGAGNTINWVPSVPNMVNIVLSADRTQATVTGVGNGNVTLQVTISNVNCGSLVVNSASINVGGIDNAGLFINHQTLCAGYPTEFGAEYGTLGYCTLLQAGITDVEWDVASPYPYQIEENYSPLGCLEVSNSGRMISFSQQYSPYTVQVRIRAKNACGWSDWSPYYSLTVQDCGGGWYMVSPNPATSEVTVTASNNKTTTTSNTTITEVNIYDQTGTLKKQQKFGKVRKATLNISNLPYGVYIIEIVNGSYKERQQLSIIKH